MKSIIIMLSVLVLAAISIPSAQSAPYLYASTFGFYMDGWSDGGSGTTVLAHSDSSEYSDPPYLYWTLSVQFEADTAQGKMGADLLSHTSAPIYSRTGPGAGADAYMTDYFHIGAGDTGLPIGAEVQIRFLSGFAGNILLEGSPSGGCYVHYNSYIYKSSVGYLATLNTDTDVVPAITSMYPPVNQIVNTSINQVVDVNVGDVLEVYSFFSMDLNGSGYSGEPGYPASEGDNNLGFLNSGYARVGYAAGYEGLDIWSEGGATIIPEPATICLLGLGALSLVSRKK
jgi:hypothetical protein